MIALQPAMLWGATLAAAPILIHLLNRLRYRSVRWGAMMFLRRLSRSGARRSRWRQWLILACRALALVALAMAMARWLAGGRLGGLSRGGAPDAVLTLLDRSASMERPDALAGTSLREQALREWAAVPAERVRGSRIVLIESALREPREVASLAVLPSLTSTAATDTAADGPAMFEAALDWIERHRPGRTEIWVATDGQTSNWRPSSLAWHDLAERLAGMVPTPRVRILPVRSAPLPGNRSLRARNVRHLEDGRYALGYALAGGDGDSAPLEATLIAPSGRTRYPLPAETGSGEAILRADDRQRWAGLALPPDGFAGDNVAWFAFGPAPEGEILARTTAGTMANRIRHALLPPRATDRHPVRFWPAPDEPPPALEAVALVVWQGRPPHGAHARALDRFVREGGVLLALPPDTNDAPDMHDPNPDADDNALANWDWEPEESASAERVWRVARWEREEGPWARTRDGSDLPLGEAPVRRRRPYRALQPETARALAHFDDGSVALTRETVGQGRVYALATLPLPDWSGLDDGRLWVPTLWRLREQGARRLGEARMAICGEWRPDSPDELWEPEHTDRPLDPRLHAGIYRSGARRMALNRPAEEDDSRMLDAATWQSLLPGAQLDVVAPTAGRVAGPVELSGALFLLAAIFLLTEAMLATGLLATQGDRT